MIDLTLQIEKILVDLEDNSANIIIDSRGMNLTFSNYSFIKNIAKNAQPKINRSCFVGVNKYSLSLLKVYKRFTSSKALFLDTLEEAVKYVTNKE